MLDVFLNWWKSLSDNHREFLTNRREYDRAIGRVFKSEQGGIMTIFETKFSTPHDCVMVLAINSDKSLIECRKYGDLPEVITKPFEWKVTFPQSNEADETSIRSYFAWGYIGKRQFKGLSMGVNVE